MHIFEFCFWEDPPPTKPTGPQPIQVVPKQTLFFSDISVSVAQIKKFKKTKSTFFLLKIWLLGGLVPKHCFTDISVSVVQIKKIKNKVNLFFNFASGRTLPTHSTGPQTPFFTDISVSVAQIKKIPKRRCIFFKF